VAREIAASETVRRCLLVFLAFEEGAARDSANWRGAVRDLGCGRGGGSRGRTHLLILRPARVIGVAFLAGVAAFITIKSVDG
jgi:hypothetical protein